MQKYTIIFEKWDGFNAALHIKHVETNDLRKEVDSCFNVKFILDGHVNPICDNCLQEMKVNDFHEIEHFC